MSRNDHLEGDLDACFVLFVWFVRLLSRERILIRERLRDILIKAYRFLETVIPIFTLNLMIFLKV